jgi:hypothetical protein
MVWFSFPPQNPLDRPDRQSITRYASHARGVQPHKTAEKQRSCSPGSFEGLKQRWFWSDIFGGCSPRFVVEVQQAALQRSRDLREDIKAEFSKTRLVLETAHATLERARGRK